MAPRMRRRITSAKREEIEKEQEQLSKSIVRPFDVVAGLPMSYNTPPYGHYEDVLKNPLTVKDSGILYRSLMKSRSNYVNGGPMFKLYWLKQSAYAKRIWNETKPAKGEYERRPVLGTDVNARDVMVKLCDCGLTLGPHTFEIRMFIAKDERSDKPAKDDEMKIKEENEIDVSKELELAIPPVQSSNGVNDSNNSMANDPNDALVDEPNDSVASEPNDSVKPDETNDSMDKDSMDIDSTNGSNSTAPSVPPSTNQSTNPSTNQSTNQSTNPSTGPQSKPVDSSPPAVKPVTTPRYGTLANRVPVSGNLPGNLPSLSGGTSSNNFSRTSTPIPSSTPPNTASPIYQRQSPPPSMLGKPVPPKKTRFDLDSPENLQTIKNLNTLARFDPGLHRLMEEVATGKAPSEKVALFQGFTARAREMGPPPHPYLAPNFKMNPHIPFKLKNLLRDRKSSKPPKHSKEKDQRLTAFQERYLTRATLLFEFVENPNVRFQIPRSAICEVLSSTSSDERDVLISFLWIHNSSEVEAYEADLKKYEDAVKEREQKEKEEEEKRKEDEKKQAEEEERQKQIEEGKIPAEESEALPASSRTRRRPNASASKKSKKPVNRAPKKLVPPEMPEVRFTPVSFQLHEIPMKFVPIITNSFDPADKVKTYMEGVLEKGIRTSSLNLWYQVDGKLDEDLAENIRSELVQEERKMTGFIATSSSITKKRKL